MFDQRVDRFARLAKGLGAGDEGIFETSHAPLQVDDQGGFHGVVVAEVLAGKLGVAPVVDGAGPRFDRRLGVVCVVAEPGGVQAGPAGVGWLSHVGEDHGMAEELAGFFRDAWFEQLPLIAWGCNEVDGGFVNGGNVSRAIAAVRATLHPEGDGRAERAVGASVEVWRFVGIGIRRRAQKMVGGEPAGTTANLSTNQVHESAR